MHIETHDTKHTNHTTTTTEAIDEDKCNSLCTAKDRHPSTISFCNAAEPVEVDKSTKNLFTHSGVFFFITQCFKCQFICVNFPVDYKKKHGNTKTCRLC